MGLPRGPPSVLFLRSNQWARCPLAPTAKMAVLQLQKRVPPSPSRIDLVTDEVVYRLAFANERKFIPAHQRLCGQRARIVIGGHDKSIGPCAHDREQISGAQL